MPTRRKTTQASATTSLDPTSGTANPAPPVPVTTKPNTRRFVYSIYSLSQSKLTYSFKAKEGCQSFRCRRGVYLCSDGCKSSSQGEEKDEKVCYPCIFMFNPDTFTCIYSQTALLATLHPTNPPATATKKRRTRRYLSNILLVLKIRTSLTFSNTVKLVPKSHLLDCRSLLLLRQSSRREIGL